ncbi:MAG: hypothetical protein J5722_04835, partial [Oscillospiraceae bacterium]|nr:hypothetical protein [Oscillospiraceae bacterium]
CSVKTPCRRCRIRRPYLILPANVTGSAARYHPPCLIEQETVAKGYSPDNIFSSQSTLNLHPETIAFFPLCDISGEPPRAFSRKSILNLHPEIIAFFPVM